RMTSIPNWVADLAHLDREPPNIVCPDPGHIHVSFEIPLTRRFLLPGLQEAPLNQVAERSFQGHPDQQTFQMPFYKERLPIPPPNRCEFGRSSLMLQSSPRTHSKLGLVYLRVFPSRAKP